MQQAQIKDHANFDCNHVLTYDIEPFIEGSKELQFTNYCIC